jgi:hypothetical protein
MIMDVEHVMADVVFGIIKDEHIVKAISWLERHRDDWFSLRKEATNFILYGDRFPLELVVSVAYSIAKRGEYKYLEIIGSSSEEKINMLEKKRFPERLNFRIFKQKPGVADVGSDYFDIVKIDVEHIKNALDFLADKKKLKLKDCYIMYNGNKCPWWWHIVTAVYWVAKDGFPHYGKSIPAKDLKRDFYRILYIVTDKIKEIDGCHFYSTQKNNFWDWLWWEPNELGRDFIGDEGVEKYADGIKSLYADLQENDPNTKCEYIWNIRSPDEVDKVLRDCEKNSDLLKNEYGIKGLKKYKEFLLDDSSCYHGKVDEELNDSVDIGINFDKVKEEHVRKALDYLYDVQDYGKYKASTHFVLYKNKKITLKLVLAVAYGIAEIGESEIEKLDGYNTHQIADFLKSANLLNVLRDYNTHRMVDILEAKGFADKIGYKIEIVKMIDKEIKFDIIKKEHIEKALDWLAGQKLYTKQESYFVLRDDGKKYPLNLVFRVAYWLAVDGRESTKRKGIDWCKYTQMIYIVESFGYHIEVSLRKKFESWLGKQINTQGNVEYIVPAATKIYAHWRTQESISSPDLIWEISDPKEVDRVIEYSKKNTDLFEFSKKWYYDRGIDGLEYYKNFLEQSKGGAPDTIEESVKGGENIIFYGVPGSGKSTAIKKEIGKVELGREASKDECEDAYNKCLDEDNIMRVVFHPDYMYSDFTGQILPKIVEGVEGQKVEYEFRPGPFTMILKKALARPTEPFFLIIEEINRGNAAAIFGDLFQLLDRDDDGESEYQIDNHEMQEVIHGKYYTFDKKIYIPANLWLLATMNTSDQNVFPLDTAFQRRWEMELIPNKFGEKQRFCIKGTNVTWEKFAEVVNKELEKPDTMMSGDKRLGAWFIKPDIEDSNNKDKKLVSRERFAYKVLKYLLDDAFKFNPELLFDTGIKTMEKVIDVFNIEDDGQGFGNLFNTDITKLLTDEQG